MAPLNHKNENFKVCDGDYTVKCLYNHICPVKNFVNLN